MFGTGDVAVRALSGLLAVASLPLMWLAGRRLAGRRGPARRPRGWRGPRCCCWRRRRSPSATPPRPGCTRWSCCWSWSASSPSTPSADRARGRRRRRWASPPGLLLLTHYWAFFLVAVAWRPSLASAVRRRRRRAPAGRWWPWAPGRCCSCPGCRRSSTRCGTRAPRGGAAQAPGRVRHRHPVRRRLLRHRRCRWACSSTASSPSACSALAPAPAAGSDRHPRPPGPAAGADAGRRRRPHPGARHRGRPDHRLRLRRPLRGRGLPPGPAAGRPGHATLAGTPGGPGGARPGRRPRLRQPPSPTWSATARRRDGWPPPSGPRPARATWSPTAPTSWARR